MYTYQNKTHWSLWLIVLGLIGAAGAILYAGFLRQPSSSGIVVGAKPAESKPLEVSLDFSALDNFSTASNIVYPALSGAGEVGVNLGSLFKSLPSGAGTPGATFNNK
jgi:hypothetical protein